jgi:ABC-type glycerol-3-phosphate transport system substrate-binding protein
MKRSSFFLTVLILTLSLSASLLLSSCSRGGQSKGKENTLVVWHWMTDRDDTFQEMCLKYKELTGVTIKMELYAPSDVYTQKVRAAAQTNTLPDVFGILGESRDVSTFVRAKHVLEITSYLDENNGQWRNMFDPKALATNSFQEGNNFNITPGVYGIPIDVTDLQILYNKSIFEKAGLDPEKPPKTWQEFVDAGEKIKASGRSVFVSGFAEIWLINSMANCFAINIMGYDKFEQTIKGEVPYTDPDWIKVFSIFKEMTDRGFFMSGVVSMVNKQAERNFSLEEAAFAYNGSWCVNVYRGMAPDLKYGVMMPPRVVPENGMMIQGGAGSVFFVNSNSSKKDMAIAFLKWLTSDEEQIYLADKTNNLPSNKNTFTKVSSPILQDFVRDMDKTFHPNTMKYSEHPRVLEALGKGIQLIIIKEKTPEQVAEEAQSLKNSLKQ